MKRIALLLLILCFVVPDIAKAQQHQQEAIVKTRGRLQDDGSIVEGRRIAEATVVVKEVATIAWAWSAHRPITVSVALEEISPANNNLPQLSDAEVTLILEDDVRRIRLHSLNEVAQFTNIPKNLLGSDATLKFEDFPDAPECRDYHPTDVCVTLTEEIRLPIFRDTVKYGQLRARVLDSKNRPMSNYTLEVAGMRVTTNDRGYIDTLIPFANQSQSYVVMGDTLRNIGLTSRYVIYGER